MGVVLNRPSEARVADAVPALEGLAGDGDLVRIGGPVSPEAVVVLGDFEDPEEAARAVVGSLGLLDPDHPHPGLRRMRVYAGYAGWAPGQLEGEIDEGAWIVEPAGVDDPFADDDLWSRVLKRKGGGYRLLATMPSDPWRSWRAGRSGR